MRFEEETDQTRPEEQISWGGETRLSKAALQVFMRNVGIYQTFKVQK